MCHVADAEILSSGQTPAWKISCDGRAFLREFMGFHLKWEQVRRVLVISPWLEGAAGKLPGVQANTHVPSTLVSY